MRAIMGFTIGLALAVYGCDRGAPEQHDRGASSATPRTAADTRDTASNANRSAEDELMELAKQRRGTQSMPDPAGELPADHPSMSGMGDSGMSAGGGRLPAGHPPIGPDSPEIAPATEAGPQLTFDTPEGWTPVRPSTSMRVAQYKLSAPEGGEPAELAVFFFGPEQGGPVQMNIDRWRSMLRDDEGEPVSAALSVQRSFEHNGFTYTTLDAAGHYQPQAMMGAPRSEPISNARMLAAVIETPNGKWFVRTVGPAATISRHVEAFEQFLKSAEFESK